MKRVLVSGLLVLLTDVCGLAEAQRLTPIALGLAGNEVPEWEAYAESHDWAYVGMEWWEIWLEGSDDQEAIEDVYMRHPHRPSPIDRL